jgi:ATP phosphoribosyltransferase regulatory subunit HisZ
MKVCLIDAEKVPSSPIPGIRQSLLQRLKHIASPVWRGFQDHLRSWRICAVMTITPVHAFAIFAPNCQCCALARGGRYDEVGAVFGRNRPAAGFSLDLKALVAAVPTPCPSSRDSCALAQRRKPGPGCGGLCEPGGEIVMRVLPGHESEVDEFNCDRQLVELAGQWQVQAL